MDDFSNSIHYKDARERLKLALLVSTIESMNKNHNIETTKTNNQILSIILAAERERPKSLNDYHLSVMVLAAFLSSLDAEPYRVSFSEIKPEDGEKYPILGFRNVSKGNTISGTLKSSKNLKAELRHVIMPPNGNQGSKVILCEGALASRNPDICKRNFSASVAITTEANSDENFIWFTELPDEWIFLSWDGALNRNNSGISMSIEPILPNGRGTVIRFKGLVRDYFDGFTIHCDEKYPIAFVLLDDTGLTYITGKGSVIDCIGKT
jgi:hypothetical protein